jgi:hypothetical protein
MNFTRSRSGESTRCRIGPSAARQGSSVRLVQANSTLRRINVWGLRKATSISARGSIRAGVNMHVTFPVGCQQGPPHPAFLYFLAFASLFFGGPVSWSRADTPVIVLDGTDRGRIFDGIGALSAGASSRLLFDYPAKQRNEILDYLFKPDYGAALQINKVEIGSDANSTDGSEPSHMRSPSDQNYSRGYEWRLMVQSKKRNPGEKIYILEWGAPGWINPGGSNVWMPANYQYIINFISHAKSDYGLTIDYVGGWNERGYDKQWYEGFRKALDSASYGGVNIVGDDSFKWTIGGAMADDPDFSKSIDIVGQHYPDSSPTVLADQNFQASLKTGKPIWFSEMGSEQYDVGALDLAKTFNQSYIDDRATANINWSTIWAAYAGLPYPGDGLMLADEPWSGHYYVGKSIWACAHTTQFASPGWLYLNGACGYFGGKQGSGSYVTLMSPNGTDYSVVVETADAKQPQTVSFAVTGGLSTGILHVWGSNLRSNSSRDWFNRQPDVIPVSGAYTCTFQPGWLYSLTTTTGQSKGSATPPPSKLLKLPYKDDFSSYAIGATPKYFSDQMGAFEVANAAGGRSGKCLRQVVTTSPILWSGPGDPSTVVGDPRWKDYTVSSDVLLEEPGYVEIVGRVEDGSNGNSNVINGYHLRITNRGVWSLICKTGVNDKVLASGMVQFSLNTWHNLKLQFSGDEISGSIDGHPVASKVFGGDFDRGLAGLEVNKWQSAEFQNFLVTSAPPGPEPIAVRSVSATATSENGGYGASNAIDGDISTMWHTRFDPTPDALPQSITIDLGSVKKVDTLCYLPRTDGNPNGIITGYDIQVSADGINYSETASGEWSDDNTKKLAHFTIVAAKYVRLTAKQGHGGFASAAEIYVALSTETK